MKSQQACLGAEDLRRAFDRRAEFVWPAEIALDAAQARAAVLLLILLQPQGLTVLLTRRTEHLYHHPGQISFPGGRMEEADASLQAAALRETEEEIGVAAGSVSVIGNLPMYATTSGFQVLPVVGLIEAPQDYVLDSFEVAEVFEVPLAFLLDQANYQRHRVVRNGRASYFYAVPYRGRFIWGATAGMLAMFAEYVQAA